MPQHLSFECEARPPHGAECPGCGCEIDHGHVDWMHDGDWLGYLCPVCGIAIGVEEDVWDAMMQSRPRQRYRRITREPLTYDSVARNNPVDAQNMRDAGRL